MLTNVKRIPENDFQREGRNLNSQQKTEQRRQVFLAYINFA